MSHLRHSILSVALVTAAIGAGAQTAAPSQPTPSNRQAPVATKPANADQMAAMDSKMKAMRDMHEKMSRAKTPEERNALMAEQMKLMQEGMDMMGGMGPGGMGGMMGMGGMRGGATPPADMATRQQMMEKRMDMMQSMMQMMMDRMPAAPTK